MKKSAGELCTAGDTASASDVWEAFKKVRNTVNNRKKYEEKNFKSDKVASSLDSPANTWNAAKSFMDWGKSGGSP